ncbi:hypothetical protein [Endozoicomonas lisbonensis]|uniref:Uncharacterized protein n=1 Tax=Endozoicomonas lisbonensis TaxID=3120522 RepID=A0ABV2SBE3_9GAMM
MHLDAVVLQELNNIHLMWKNSRGEEATRLNDSESSDTRTTFQTANNDSLGSSSYKTALEGLVEYTLPESGIEFDSQASSVIPRLGRKRKQGQDPPFEQELEHFFQWLAGQDTSKDGQWLITRVCKNEKGGTIEPGSYQSPPEASDIKAISCFDNEPGYKTYLDQRRIRKALKNPSAVLVQDNMLHVLLKEWLSLKKPL